MPQIGGSVLRGHASELSIGCCRYAWECQTAEGGWGLDGVLREGAWKLRGIVNGIDTAEWSPERDAFLQSDGYANYSAADLRAGKARCKAALQRVRCPGSKGLGSRFQIRVEVKTKTKGDGSGSLGLRACLHGRHSVL